ncbi:MAG: HlyD family efflux transporter periplasmic adaptor subunit [Acidobacteria bacterium]|nr:HlyD family efflux transporter periplasmic adaptor subunit [Acidobacteriota bacterium]
MNRLIRIALIVIVLVLLAYWAFRPRPVPADFAAVERGTLQVTVEDEGRTRVRDRFVVSAPVPGRMERIALEPGDPVVAGKTVLARFQPTDPALLDVRTRGELEARVRAAQSAVGAARADRDRLRGELAFAQSELKRMQTIADAVAQRDIDAAAQQVEALERAVQSAEFNVQTAQHQVELARASLVQTRGGQTAAIPLYSPVSGVVLRRLQESEAVVPTGQPFLEVGDVGEMEIVADLLSSAAVRVQPGQQVLIEQWGGERSLTGRVRRVEPSGFTKISALGVEEQRVNVIIDFDDSPDARPGIGDGYRVEVRIIVASRDNTLKVPSSSLFRHEGGWAVYRVEDGRAIRQRVELGQQSGLEAEVVSGLDEGQQIVVYPSDAIGDGVQVVAR